MSTDFDPRGLSTAQFPANVPPYSAPSQVADIPSFDGTLLRARLYRPDVAPNPAWKAPVILIYTPYEGNAALDDPTQSASTAALIGYFVPRGFAVALVNCRGTGASQGVIDFLGAADVKDYRAVVAYLAALPWTNGRVGGHGLSYVAALAQRGLLAGAPGLACSVLAETLTDVYDGVYYGAVPQLTTSALLVPIGALILAQAASNPPPLNPTAVTAYLISRGLSAGAFPLVLPTSNGDYTADYAARDARALVVDGVPRGAADVAAAVLYARGWRDHILNGQADEGWVDGLVNAAFVRSVYGPWGHVDPDGGTLPEAWVHVLHAFYDRFLLALPTNIDAAPEVLASGLDGRWHATTRAALAARTPLRLDANSLLPAADRKAASAFARDTSGLWFTPPFAAAGRLCGQALLPLWVRQNATDGDWIAALDLLANDGVTYTRVGVAALNSRHRASLSAPSNVPVGVDVPGTLRFMFTDTPVAPGERLRLALAGQVVDNAAPPPLNGAFVFPPRPPTYAATAREDDAHPSALLAPLAGPDAVVRLPATYNPDGSVATWTPGAPLPATPAVAATTPALPTPLSNGWNVPVYLSPSGASPTPVGTPVPPGTIVELAGNVQANAATGGGVLDVLLDGHPLVVGVVIPAGYTGPLATLGGEAAYAPQGGSVSFRLVTFGPGAMAVDSVVVHYDVAAAPPDFRVDVAQLQSQTPHAPGEGTNSSNEPLVRTSRVDAVAVASNRWIQTGAWLGLGATGGPGARARDLTWAGPIAEANADNDPDAAFATALNENATYNAYYVVTRDTNTVLWACTADDGATFTHGVVGATSVDILDRPYVCAQGEDDLWVVWNRVAAASANETGTVEILHSADRGQTWSAPVVVAPVDLLGPSPGGLGPQVIDHASGGARRYVVVAMCTNPAASTLDELRVYASADGGATWTPHVVASTPGVALTFLPALTVAPDGSLWVAYGINGGLLARRSTDRGATWSAADVVTGALPGAVFPAVVAGAAGVAVAFYGTLDPDVATRRWRLYLARNPTGAPGGWLPPEALTGTVHWGPIDVGGLGGTTPASRSLGDLLGIALDGSGYAHVAYALDDAATGLAGVWYAVQTAGPTLGTPNR